ncbi:MAG: hypothetical protein A2Z14_13095 [Chloroflexi bacterium RBG_16_48_8]|nr:MAG: hypothetical protein A2Z14_13095 [Chloroflexi bacterium RBG_16_48_8]
MMDQMHFEIAGVGFSTSYPRTVDLQKPVSDYPVDFRKVSAGRGADVIDIRLELVNASEIEGLIKLCDSGQTWSIFREGDGYVLSFNPISYPGTPLWLARFNQDCTWVTIQCSEKFIDESDGRTTLLNPVRYPLDQLLLMYYLAGREGALLHAAGVNINGRGFIFPGRSGAGKSTLSRLLADGQDMQVLSDDRMVVRKIDHSFWAFGTPWPGDEGIARNERMPLSGVMFLHHSQTNRVKPITAQKALESLFPVTSIPWYDKDIMLKLLRFCEELITNIPSFELEFKPSHEVIKCLKDFASSLGV